MHSLFFVIGDAIGLEIIFEKKNWIGRFFAWFFVDGAFYWIENTIQSIWKWNEQATFQVSSFDCRIKNVCAAELMRGMFQLSILWQHRSFKCMHSNCWPKKTPTINNCHCITYLA